VGYLGTCRDQPVFKGEVVYVSVRLGDQQPIDTPPAVRQALGEAVELTGAEAAAAGQQ
jgi:acyl-CoA thioesterase FadM